MFSRQKRQVVDAEVLLILQAGCAVMAADLFGTVVINHTSFLPGTLGKEDS